MTSNVLIVDDELSDRFIIKRMLKRSDLDVEISECADGVEALSYLGNAADSGCSRPQLILLDLNMPRIGGLEFLQRYENLIENNPSVRCPVLMMLTSASREDENACLAFESVKGIVSKEPEHPGVFVDAVARELSPEVNSKA
ncbi:MAG: hypothetical protein Aurels2KO_25840 [Aureliella sp.]